MPFSAIMAARPPRNDDVEPAHETLFALDNIPLDLPIARAASRVLSGFLDYLVLIVLTLLWILALTFLQGLFKWRATWMFALFIFGYFLLEYGYFAAVEVATGGRSFGKWTMGLAVVTRRGGRPPATALLLRNAVRSVDLLVGIPLMLLDPLSRRLGDRLAGTLVVHVRRSEEWVLHRVPRGWGARELAILESFLRRAPDLEPERSQRMAHRLLACIERDDPDLLRGAPAVGDPVERLRQALSAEKL
jgi:uncharacterized RDD family membrane protein YckC